MDKFRTARFPFSAGKVFVFRNPLLLMLMLPVILLVLALIGIFLFGGLFFKSNRRNFNKYSKNKLKPNRVQSEDESEFTTVILDEQTQNDEQLDRSKIKHQQVLEADFKVLN